MSTLQYPTGNYLGWYYYSGGTLVPANNLVIKDGEKLAVFLSGGNGQYIFDPIPPAIPAWLGANFITTLAGLNVYDKVLAIVYSSNLSGEQDALDFVYSQLVQLIKLKHLSIDIFAYSNGTIMARYSMEVKKLGKYKQFQNVVLGGSGNQGLYAGDLSNISDPNLLVATAIQESFFALVVSGSYSNFLATLGSVLSNPSFDTRYPGSGYNGVSIMENINEHKISDKIYENLKYYTVSGTPGPYELGNFFPVSVLASLLGPNPYITLAVLAGLSGPDLALALLFQTLYPSIGLLQKYANSISPAVQPLIGDGIVVPQTEVLKTKSEFYKKHQYSANLFVPQTHLSIYDTSLPNMTQFWTNLVESLGHGCSESKGKFCLSQPTQRKIDQVIVDFVTKITENPNATKKDIETLITPEYIKALQIYASGC